MRHDDNPTRRMDDTGGQPFEPSRPAGTPRYQPTEPMNVRGVYQSGFPPGSSYVGNETEVLRGKPASIIAWLVVTNGPHAGYLYRIPPGSCVIGRDPTCDIAVDDTAMSRQHLRIRLVETDKEPQFMLHDLGTENGTILNGEMVDKHALEDGESIEIGRITFVYKQVLLGGDRD